MNLARRTAILVLLVVVAAARPGPAAAGGSAFGFPRPYYAPGEEAKGSTSFDPMGVLPDHPVHAYLLPEGTWIEPPGVPSGAVDLGAVAFSGPGGDHARVRLAFTVPSVPPGGYGISLCDVPCRTTSFGDLIGGWIRVVATPEEARTRALIDEAQSAVWDEVSATSARIDEMARRVQSALADYGRAQLSRSRELSERIDAVQARVSALEEELATATARAEGSPWLGGWAAAGGVALAWAGSALRRRREDRSEPDPGTGASPSPRVIDLGDLSA